MGHNNQSEVEGQRKRARQRTADLDVVEPVFRLASGTEGVSVGRLPNETGHVEGVKEAEFEEVGVETRKTSC
jgi:hypothetical protein